MKRLRSALLKPYGLVIALCCLSCSSINPTPPFSSLECEGYTYHQGSLDHFYDGDTAWIVIDGITYKVRLALINTPELRGSTYYQASLAKRYAEYWVNQHPIFTVYVSNSYGQYNRPICWIYDNDSCLNLSLVHRNLAVIWDKMIKEY